MLHCETNLKIKIFENNVLVPPEVLESDEGHLKQDKHLILFWTNTISNKELCIRNNTIPLSQHISTRKWKWIADVQLYVECTQVPSKW